MDQNLTTKKFHAGFPSHKNFQRNYAVGIHGNYHEYSDCFEYPNLKLKSNYPKKCLSKFSYPKKSFDHPCHLKSGAPAGPYTLSVMLEF